MMASAPPTEAPNAARVLRSTLTHGSSRVNIRRLVTAWVRTPRWSSTTPQASPTRAQTRRSGTQGGRGEELVGGGADPQVDLAERLGRRDAGRLEVAQVLDAGRDGHGERVDVGGAGLVQDPGVDGDGAPAVAVERTRARGRRGGRGRGWCRAGRPRRTGRGRGCPPTDSRSATRSSRARAAAGWSVTEETTTGARSRRTSARASGRSAGGDPVVTDVHPHRGDAVLEVVEHGGPGHGGVGVVVQLAHVPRGRGVAQGAAAGERHRAGHTEVAVLAQVEGVDLEAALEVATQRGLGRGAVEAGVLGAALVEHGGDEAAASPRGPAGGSRPQAEGRGRGLVVARPTRPSS